MRSVPRWTRRVSGVCGQLVQEAVTHPLTPLHEWTNGRHRRRRLDACKGVDEVAGLQALSSAWEEDKGKATLAIQGAAA